MKNNTKSDAKLQANSGLVGTAIEFLKEARGVSGHGGYHTAKPDAKNPQSYNEVGLEDITSMVKNPKTVQKDQAQWAIFSTTGGENARVHDFQRKNGQYFSLWADLDEVTDLTFLALCERVQAAIPNFYHIIYTSSSAKQDNPKGRVLVPLSGLVPGCDYAMLARILNNRLHAAGLPPDRATERPGQICYLPNKGEFYQSQINDGPLLDPYQEFKTEITAEQVRAKKEQQESERQHQVAIQKAQERINNGQADSIEAFKQDYPVELALERYGFQGKGKKWTSPNSASGKPGVTVLNNKWYSHHSSDSAVGQPGKDGGTWGDAFDLFVYFEHGGDFNRAVLTAGDLFTTLDPKTGQTVSINKANQREYMRSQAPDTFAAFAPFAPGKSNQKIWEPIVSLDENIPTAIDGNILHGSLGDMARAVSIETETPMELSISLGLAVLATACQGKFRIQIKQGYQEPLNLWLVTALDPANRKTSVLSAMTAPLTGWERDQNRQLEPWIKESVSRRQNQEARLKTLRSKYGKAKPDELKGIEAEILEIENNLEEVPVLPKTWAQDVTPEHLGTLMAQHSERMSIISAEGGIFDIAGGRYSNGIPNLDLFLQGHAGDAVRVDRGSREPVYMEHPALSFGLSPQPGVLKGLSEKPGFRARGLLARFLYFLPGSKLGYRSLNTSPIPETVKNNYHHLIYQLLDIGPNEDEHGNKIPNILSLSQEAYQEWAEFFYTVEEGLRDGGRFESIRDWAGKLPGAAARISGLLHCAENPHQPWARAISLETMNTALIIASYFADHAEIAFDLMGADTALEGARKICRWIKKNRFEEFTKRDCFNDLKSTFKRVSFIEDPLSVLEERNYIQGETIKTGGRPSVKYTINPETTKGWS